MAVAAALIMIFLVLAVQRRQLVGATGADVDALPGRPPPPAPPPVPESDAGPVAARLPVVDDET
jgi:hypothetical protein